MSLIFGVWRRAAFRGAMYAGAAAAVGAAAYAAPYAYGRPACGYYQSVAMGINDRGQIVGYEYYAGTDPAFDYHAVVWTPVRR
jgi:hypothetical protein